MQKIMMPVKPWCDHAEGFESDLRACEPDRRRMERASGTFLADGPCQLDKEQVRMMTTMAKANRWTWWKRTSLPKQPQDLQQEGWIMTLG